MAQELTGQLPFKEVYIVENDLVIPESLGVPARDDPRRARPQDVQVSRKRHRSEGRHQVSFTEMPNQFCFQLIWFV